MMSKASHPFPLSSTIPADDCSSLPELIEAKAHDCIAHAQSLFACAKRLRVGEKDANLDAREGLTTLEACASLRISRATLDRLVREGMPVSWVGRKRLFRMSDCRAWLNLRGKRGASRAGEMSSARSSLSRSAIGEGSTQ